MAKEKSLWRYLRNGMGNRWDACRHEDRATLGVPDVSFGMRGVNGWIELKVLDVWPKRPSTVVRVDHLTDEQRRWMEARGAAGENVWLLLRVGRDYLLFYYDAVAMIGQVNREGIECLASQVWNKKIDWNAFEDVLYRVPSHRRIS